MDKLITFGRIVKAGTNNFIRNAWLSTAATAVMLITLTIMLSGIIINLTLSKEIDNIVKDITVSVYFQDGSKTQERDELEAALRRDTNVREVTYISKEDALKIFSKNNAEKPEILDGLKITENALPASFEIRVLDLKKIDPIIKVAESDKYSSFVDETSYDKDRQARIDKIANIQGTITISSLIAGVVFAAISVLIIFNTIRMAIFTRGDEIKIMKLIGAANWYVRGPFLFESALYGIVASILSLSIIYGFILSFEDQISAKIDFTAALHLFTDQWYLVVGGTFLVGVGIGMISSTLAMIRYLNLE